MADVLRKVTLKSTQNRTQNKNNLMVSLWNRMTEYRHSGNVALVKSQTDDQNMNLREIMAY